MAVPPPKSVKCSLWTLVVAGLVSVVAFVLNAPPSKDLRFDVVCETFVAPAPLTLNLSQDPTELRSVTADDFDGSVSDASIIRFARENQKLTLVPIHTLALRADNSGDHPLSYLKLTRLGAIGKLLLEVGSGVELSSTGMLSTAPSLTLASQAENDVRLTISSAQIILNEGNRYVIPEIQPKPLDGFHSTLEGKDLVALHLCSGSRPKTRAKLTFGTDQRNLPLLQAAQKLPHGAALTFTRAVNPYLRLDNKSAEGVTSDRKADLLVDCRTATVDTIAIIGDQEKREVPALRITGSGKVRSVRQDGHELMPTRLSEVLDQPVAERTGMLVLLGALAAVFLKAVDHALGVLLERLIPKG
jgi:hypothetical protein